MSRSPWPDDFVFEKTAAGVRDAIDRMKADPALGCKFGMSSYTLVGVGWDPHAYLVAQAAVVELLLGHAATTPPRPDDEWLLALTDIINSARREHAEKAGP